MNVLNVSRLTLNWYTGSNFFKFKFKCFVSHCSFKPVHSDVWTLRTSYQSRSCWCWWCVWSDPSWRHTLCPPPLTQASLTAATFCPLAGRDGGSDVGYGFEGFLSLGTSFPVQSNIYQTYKWCGAKRSQGNGNVIFCLFIYLFKYFCTHLFVCHIFKSIGTFHDNPGDWTI